MLKELFRRSHLQNVPAIDEHHPVGNFPGKLHLMGDHNHGDPAVGEGFHHQQDFANHLRIEGRGGLVKEDDLRRGGQGPGDRHPLLLPTG